MTFAEAAQRARQRAARSPRLRKLAGKPPLPGSHGPREGANASVAALGDEQIWALRSLYEGSFELPPVSYGTVRDFADSGDNMPGLAGANFDMKDMQRCWTVKAILGNVPAGGRLVEIGAGEPLVAGILSRLGYRVTVVDPYDGSGNGPREYEQFCRDYPDVEFVRDQFPPAAGLDGDYACVYSVSVLEHVPPEALDAVTTASRELLAAEHGCSIHAFDLVLAGWGAEEHMTKLERIAAGLGIDKSDLGAAIDSLREDPETYFVSAEAHNRWRGELPYEQYTMRRICSVNLLS